MITPSLVCLAAAVLLLLLLVLRPISGAAGVAMQVVVFMLFLPAWVGFVWLCAASRAPDALLGLALAGGGLIYELANRNTPAAIRVMFLIMMLVLLAVVGIRYFTTGGRW